MKTGIDPDSAQVRVPPPLLFLICILLGAALAWFHPIHIVPQKLCWILAILFMGGGIGLMAHCLMVFKKAKTNIEPWKPTHRLITSGVYRFSRNPIYLSLVLIGIGVACAANSVWNLLMLVPFIGAIHWAVILREERYLEQKFGKDYLAYKKQVRRWV